MTGPGQGQQPTNFNPATYPTLSRHWFGVEPPASLRRHRQFEHVHELGPRAVEELVVEVANGEDLDRALAAYQRLTPGLLEATSGDRFPPAPIYEVSST